VIQEFIIAVFKAGLPVALVSYALVWWALKKNYLDGAASVEEVEKGMMLLKKDKPGRKKKGGKTEKAVDPEPGSAEAASRDRKLHPAHNKWLAFGGGFYGVVGLLTYAVVELGEIRDFFVQFDGLAGLISQISLDLVIGFFIDAFMNFVIAIAWPIYWISDFSGQHVWIWFAVAYGGYWLGARYALHRATQID